MNSQELKQMQSFEKKSLGQIVSEHARDDELLKQVKKIHTLRRKFILDKLDGKKKKLFSHKKSKIMVEVSEILSKRFDSKWFQEDHADLYDKYRKEITSITLKTIRV
jgi:hypothetical protein